MLLLLLIAAVDTRANGLFVQKRIGKHGKPFNLYKIRTLKGHDHQDVLEIKENATAIGKWLRRSKLDELPQFVNVLFGNMSLVGPRPDVPGYADQLEEKDRLMLSVKPGITGPATLKYKNEDELLIQQKFPKQYNDEVLWPDKVKINNEYVKNWSFWKDLQYLKASIIS